MGDDIKDHIRYNEAETSCSGGYVKGGTKPGTATITVTREDKKELFSFTVKNVVPTTSTETVSYTHLYGKKLLQSHQS